MIKRGDRIPDFQVQCPHCQERTDIFLIHKCPFCHKKVVWDKHIVSYVYAQDLMRTAITEAEWERAAQLWRKTTGFPDKVAYCLEMAQKCREIDDIFSGKKRRKP